MKKLILASLILPAICGAFYLIAPPQPEGRGLYAPNVMHRVALPFPPNTPAPAMLQGDVLVGNTRINTQKLNPERHSLDYTFERAKLKYAKAELVAVH